MSDDEEIVCKGKNVGLYNHLTDLGYADFEYFEPENLVKEEKFILYNGYSGDKYKDRVNSAVSTYESLKITDHDHKKLVTILTSQLLFKEDADVIESLLHNKKVCIQRPNYVIHTSVVLTGLLSSALVLRNKFNSGLTQYTGLVPAGFSVLFACYSAWKFYKEFAEKRKNFILLTHINDLKKLCFNVLKLTRFIKETEILSTGQAPVYNNDSVSYVPSSLKNVDVDLLPKWKTLPHLRKCLSDTVEEVLNMLTISVNSLRQSLFHKEVVENHPTFIKGVNLNPCQPSDKEYSVSLFDLKELTSKYLSVQSEYLTELAFIFSSMCSKETSSNRLRSKFTRDKVFEMFMDLHKNLKAISFKLMMQYNTHNIDSTFKKVSHMSSSSKNQVREIFELQNGVHNVFLLLYSALLRVRNLEDTLENIGEIRESLKIKNELNLDVVEQLTVLKDDLVSTVRCYDILCQQATSKTKVEITSKDAENLNNVKEVNIKETGIVVGSSDFTVNSPDEVFLSLSGTINNEETSISEGVDDWCFEKKPQIPKSLLTELSQTLKSRKTDFKEREKTALKRKGLQNVDILSPSNDEDSDESEDSFSKMQDNVRSSAKYKRHSAALDYSHSSDSDDEMDPFESGAFLTKLKISKKYQSDPYSDSDSSVLDVLDKETSCKGEVVCQQSLSTPSLANLAALKSKMWGTNTEECYSDGSDS